MVRGEKKVSFRYKSLSEDEELRQTEPTPPALHLRASQLCLCLPAGFRFLKPAALRSGPTPALGSSLSKTFSKGHNAFRCKVMLKYLA